MGEEESILPGGGGGGQDVGWTPSSAAPAPLRSPGHGWQRSRSCWAASAVRERILCASSEGAWRVPAGLRGGCGSFCVPVLPFITSLEPVLRLPTFQLAWRWATSLLISLPLPFLSLLLSLLPFSFLHLPGAFQLHLIFSPFLLPSLSILNSRNFPPAQGPPSWLSLEWDFSSPPLSLHRADAVGSLLRSLGASLVSAKDLGLEFAGDEGVRGCYAFGDFTPGLWQRNWDKARFPPASLCSPFAKWMVNTKGGQSPFSLPQG